MSRLTNQATWLIVSVLLLTTLCAIAVGKVIYVDDDVIAIVNTGSSWAFAYNKLQDALADANSSEGPVEIRVAQGVYKPNEGIGISYRNRDASFQLVNGVILKGGYAGFGEPNADARDTVLYETILSGDLIGNDIEVSDPCDLIDEPTRGENSYTVVTVADNNCILDGFTISGGNADEPIVLPDDPLVPIVIERIERNRGGGMYIDMSSVTIINCIFRNNAARRGGGGIFSLSGEGPILDNCVFIHNSGGYIIKEESVTHIFNGGGGMENHNNRPTLINCMFIENSSTKGSGMFNSDCSLVLTNCTLSGNRTLTSRFPRIGGAIHFSEDCWAVITNCTFAQNSAENGNALACESIRIVLDGVGITSSSNIELINCILHDGGNEIWNGNDSTIGISYSNIQGGWPDGEGNIDADPLFANPGYWVDANDPNLIVESNDPDAVWINGDYHLKSQAGRWDSTEGDWIEDDVTSPCIDAGDPNSPLGDEPEPNGSRINMGAYGGTTESSKSPTD